MAGEHLRTFAKMFTNLTPGQQREFERALADLENSKEITSLATSLDLLKRKPNTFLPAPILTATVTVRGAQVEWEPLKDQRINFYEVDTSQSANFSSFSTVLTFGPRTTIDGLDASRFMRVRGVRRDGTTTPYSNTLEINPNLYEITSHSAEAFYVPITGTAANTVLGGSGSTLSYTPINPDGNSMVWGFISTYGDPAIGMWATDDIIAEGVSKIFDSDGFQVGDETIFWKNTVGEHFNSQSIGPVSIAHPELNQTIQLSVRITDTTVKSNSDPRTKDSTEVFWVHLSALELGINAT